MEDLFSLVFDVLPPDDPRVSDPRVSAWRDEEEATIAMLLMLEILPMPKMLNLSILLAMSTTLTMSAMAAITTRGAGTAAGGALGNHLHAQPRGLDRDWQACRRRLRTCEPVMQLPGTLVAGLHEELVRKRKLRMVLGRELVGNDDKAGKPSA